MPSEARQKKESLSLQCWINKPL